MTMFQLGEMVGKYFYEAFDSRILNISLVSVVGFSAGAHMASSIGQIVFQMYGNATRLPRLRSKVLSTFINVPINKIKCPCIPG